MYKLNVCKTFQILGKLNLPNNASTCLMKNIPKLWILVNNTCNLNTKHIKNFNSINLGHIPSCRSCPILNPIFFCYSKSNDAPHVDLPHFVDSCIWKARH